MGLLGNIRKGFVLESERRHHLKQFRQGESRHSYNPFLIKPIPDSATEAEKENIERHNQEQIDQVVYSARRSAKETNKDKRAGRGKYKNKTFERARDSVPGIRGIRRTDGRTIIWDGNAPFHHDAEYFDMHSKLLSEGENRLQDIDRVYFEGPVISDKGVQDLKDWLAGKYDHVEFSPQGYYSDTDPGGFVLRFVKAGTVPQA